MSSSPLSGLPAPAQDALEREEKRPRRLQLLEQQSSIAIHERSKQVGWQVTRVLGEQRPFHPLDHRFGTRQDMRIDHQTHIQCVETEVVKNLRITPRRLDCMEELPATQRG